MLQPVLLRRTKGSKIRGQPIVQLPGREQALVQPQFSQAEKAFYQKVRRGAGGGCGTLLLVLCGGAGLCWCGSL